MEALDHLFVAQTMHEKESVPSDRWRGVPATLAELPDEWGR